MGFRGNARRSGVLGALVVVAAVVAGCAGGSAGDASSGPIPSTLKPTTLVPATARPSVTAGTSGQPPPLPPSPALTPLPSSAYPPLAGFGEVHDIGSVVRLSDEAGQTVLSLERKAYVHCTPLPEEVEPCLDGYRVDDVEAGTRDYVVAPTLGVTLWIEPEQYETGDLTDLRQFVATRPSNLVILRLDAAGQVVAVGQPWLP